MSSVSTTRYVVCCGNAYQKPWIVTSCDSLSKSEREPPFP
jgi:hypothetical protein